SVGPNGTMHKDVTVNYEVDKTVRYVQQPMGGIKRLSVAVVVNYKRETDKAGKVTNKPLTDAEKAQITDLVKEAMGFNKDRGDTLNVVNSPFATEKEKIDAGPFWKQPETWSSAGYYGKWALILAVIAYLYFTFLKPIIGRIGEALKPQPIRLVHDEGGNDEEGEHMPRGYESNLERAKQLARDDPKMVANVVKTWVGGNE
ncbi:MAG: flagellar basal body M-ring protein FliF, partial [Proteobacteria bacterium]|nr:flagellar basal body M-ring protein FliF [Pseudomonadota bacterium]